MMLPTDFINVLIAYQLFYISFLFPQEAEEKELIAIEAKKLEMENEARRKLEEEKKKRAVHNKVMNLDLLSCRMSQGISHPWTYSYFQYVPPQKSKKKVIKTRTIKRK